MKPEAGRERGRDEEDGWIQALQTYIARIEGKGKVGMLGKNARVILR